MESNSICLHLPYTGMHFLLALECILRLTYYMPYKQIGPLSSFTPVLYSWFSLVIYFIHNSDLAAAAAAVYIYGLPRWSSGKEPTCQAGDTRDEGLIPGSGRTFGVGNSNTLYMSVPVSQFIRPPSPAWCIYLFSMFVSLFLLCK